MNKKAGEKYLSIWWIAILTIIAAAIVAAFWVYNSSDLDVRGIEGNILSARLIECVVENGYLNQTFLEDTGNKKFDIFQECGFDKKMIDESGKYHLSLSVYDFDKCSLIDPKDIDPSEEGYFQQLKCGKPLKQIKVGANFEEDCKVGKSVKVKDSPKCDDRFVYVLSQDNKKLLLHVIGGSYQYGKKEVLQ